MHATAIRTNDSPTDRPPGDSALLQAIAQDRYGSAKVLRLDTMAPQSQRLAMFVAAVDHEWLERRTELVEQGQVTPSSGKASAKTVITVKP